MKNAPERFNANYYRRYYLNPPTRSTNPSAAGRLAAFIAAYTRHLGVRPRRILDIGCGLGWTLSGLEREFPSARCVGVEYSPYLCGKHGWQSGSVVDFRAPRPFDLVVCNDVLPSLDDRACTAAIANLGALTRSVLFVGALTEEDWAQCDKRRTDPNVFLRPVRWYRRRFEREVVNLGGGLFAKRDAPIVHCALDCLGSPT